MVTRDLRAGGQRERIGAKGARGFSLAELLVVIAIIAILAGILYPVIRQAQDTAKMRTCTSNLKQLGFAFRLYLDDNNGFALPAPDPLPFDWDSALRPEPLMKYTKQASVQPYGNPKRLSICPGDVGYGAEPPRWRSGAVPTSSYYYPYDGYTARPGNIDVSGGRTSVNSPRRPDMWPRPTRDMVLSDFSATFHRGKKDDSSPEGAVKCVNFLMLDGHVIAGTRADLVQRYPVYATIYDNPFTLTYDPSVEL